MWQILKQVYFFSLQKKEKEKEKKKEDVAGSCVWFERHKKQNKVNKGI